MKDGHMKEERTPAVLCTSMRCHLFTLYYPFLIYGNYNTICRSNWPGHPFKVCNWYFQGSDGRSIWVSHSPLHELKYLGTLWATCGLLTIHNFASTSIYFNNQDIPRLQTSEGHNLNMKGSNIPRFRSLRFKILSKEAILCRNAYCQVTTVHHWLSSNFLGLIKLSILQFGQFARRVCTSAIPWKGNLGAPENSLYGWHRDHFSGSCKLIEIPQSRCSDRFKLRLPVIWMPKNNLPCELQRHNGDYI